MRDPLDDAAAWLAGVPLADLPAGAEELLRELAGFYAQAAGRAVEDFARLASAMAATAEGALGPGLYAHGRADGLHHAAKAAMAMRDAYATMLDLGPGARRPPDADQ